MNLPVSDVAAVVSGPLPRVAARGWQAASSAAMVVEPRLLCGRSYAVDRENDDGRGGRGRAGRRLLGRDPGRRAR